MYIFHDYVQQHVYMSRSKNTDPHRDNLYGHTSKLGEGNGKGRPITCMKAKWRKRVWIIGR